MAMCGGRWAVGGGLVPCAVCCVMTASGDNGSLTEAGPAPPCTPRFRPSQSLGPPTGAPVGHPNKGFGGRRGAVCFILGRWPTVSENTVAVTFTHHPVLEKPTTTATITSEYAV